ncbi:hypothetical protein CTAYLR_004941 [Chrysophaeum taylorii]|uniref:ubiquitinyl hydrolase 1 n=1 Tax=Chrysophaeum taylorii TaxID=2483200 RepID=A0AAD7XSD3_9STRA|nr:hypothetical protein CTAYLR_004941 [Chrysophaeum taylorii]
MTRRSEPCGLENLGATCYLGSLLQVLYSSVAFRRAVYGQAGPLARCLEKIFAELEFGNRKSSSVSELTELLELDPREQQDPKEFGKLFVTRLEDQLPPPPVFRGKLEHATRCSECGRESRRLEKFDELELAISGDTVANCLRSHFSEEDLTGENKYHCDVCGVKQNATRYSRIAEPPSRLLFVHLLRYVYAGGEKKKLKTSVRLNETLEVGGAVFFLNAVVYHRGESASGGHYVVRAKDSSSTTKWFEYDDDKVSMICPSAPAAAARGEAYILAYVRGSDPPLDKSSLSKETSAYVEEKNAEHDRACAAFERRAARLEAAVAARRAACDALFFGKFKNPAAEVNCHGELCGQYGLLETDLVAAWVTGEDLVLAEEGEKVVAPPPRVPLLCEHGITVSRAHLPRFKCLKKSAYDKIVGDLGINVDVELTEATCARCAASQRILEAKEREKDELRLALRDDLRLAQQQQQQQNGAGDFAAVSKSLFCQLKKRRQIKKTRVEETSATKDIVCPHGGLDPQSSFFFVDHVVWRRVQTLYPSSKELREVCGACADRASRALRLLDQKRAELTPALSRLLNRNLDDDDDDDTLLRGSLLCSVENELRAVSLKWLARWVAYHARDDAPAPGPHPLLPRCGCGSSYRVPAWTTTSEDADLAAFAAAQALDTAKRVADLVRAGCEEQEDCVALVSEDEFEALRISSPSPRLIDGRWDPPACDACLAAEKRALELARTHFSAQPIKFARDAATRRRPRKPNVVPADSTDSLGLVLLRLCESIPEAQSSTTRLVVESTDGEVVSDLASSLQALGIKARSTLVLRILHQDDDDDGAGVGVGDLAAAFAAEATVDKKRNTRKMLVL